MSLRVISLFLVKFTVSIGLLTWLFQKIDTAALTESINAITVSVLILKVVVTSASVVVQGYRWNIILSFMNAKLPWLVASKNVVIGIFFGQFLPSTVGGDVVRIWLANRHGLPMSLAANSIVADRIFGFIGLVTLCAIGLPFLIFSGTDLMMVVGESILIAMAIASVAVLVGLQYIPAHWKKWRIIRWSAGISDASAGVILQSGKGAGALTISLVLHVLEVVMIYFMAVACGIEISLAACLMLIPPALLVSAIPVSIAGWGLREGAIAFALNTVGVPTNDAITLSLFVGVSLMLTGLVGGLVWLLTSNERKLSKVENG